MVGKLMTTQIDGGCRSLTGVVEGQPPIVSKAVHQTVSYSCPSSPRVDFWTLLTSSHVSVNHVDKMLQKQRFILFIDDIC